MPGELICLSTSAPFHEGESSVTTKKRKTVKKKVIVTWFISETFFLEMVGIGASGVPRSQAERRCNRIGSIRRDEIPYAFST
jgi:hypothetical protein